MTPAAWALVLCFGAYGVLLLGAWLRFRRDGRF